MKLNSLIALSAGFSNLTQNDQPDILLHIHNDLWRALSQLAFLGEGKPNFSCVGKFQIGAIKVYTRIHNANHNKVVFSDAIHTCAHYFTTSAFNAVDMVEPYIILLLLSFDFQTD